ncbi:oxidative stress survival, Svf1-like protein [Papiliotrema laurentii]|uniref:Oxidative stress survival, Svf1-like protein n=1 Tax=Papiliotrema laurentii TaxID=5418 RepID=A0AAD9D154_PAPLA|nr:oxidative stress survival, Svf1-like protein [Papiliotrema laurentii]
MSWFSSKSENTAVQNFYPITTYAKGYGSLTDKDTEWTCASNRGFQTETKTWYSVLEDGSLLLMQVIWSYVGVFVIPATAQFTFKHYNPKTKKATWKSVNGSNFKANGHGCKCDQFEVKHEGSANGTETYTITGALDKNVQLNVTLTRPADAPGFKFGEGPDGGFSTFGKSREDGKRDGLVVHRFHPIVHSSGSVILDGQVVDAKGDGMFVHAIQGMRPDSIASRWNFAFFTSGGGKEESKLGAVRAIQMEFETTDAYGPTGPKSGRTKVNIGTVYTTAKSPVPFLAVGQTSVNSSATFTDGVDKASTDISSAKHISPVHDSETGYDAPSGIEFKWSGDRRDGEGRLTATLTVDKLGATQGEGGLIEKVDVLQEIPYVIRKALAAVTGTKPYIYQYHNAATLQVEVDGETIPVHGWLFNEASFVSE